jgi:hypothetical protein
LGLQFEVGTGELAPRREVRRPRARRRDQPGGCALGESAITPTFDARNESVKSAPHTMAQEPLKSVGGVHEASVSVRSQRRQVFADFMPTHLGGQAGDHDGEQSWVLAVRWPAPLRLAGPSDNARAERPAIPCPKCRPGGGYPGPFRFLRELVCGCGSRTNLGALLLSFDRFSAPCSGISAAWTPTLGSGQILGVSHLSGDIRRIRWLSVRICGAPGISVS